jgi:hypothetical protein
VDESDLFPCFPVVCRAPNKNYKMGEAHPAVARVVHAEGAVSRSLPLALPPPQDKEIGIVGAGVDEEALGTGLYWTRAALDYEVDWAEVEARESLQQDSRDFLRRPMQVRQAVGMPLVAQPGLDGDLPAADEDWQKEQESAVNE